MYYVISDIHLSRNRPDLNEKFMSFLDSLYGRASRLYIIGDLFDVWFGDDIATHFELQIADKIFNLSRSVEVYFIHGNRDFLLGKQYLGFANIKQLKDTEVIKVGAKNIMLSHGDIFCTKDLRYQLFRKIVRNKLLTYLFLKIPKSTRVKLGKKIQNKAKSSKMKYLSSDKIEVNKDKIIRVMHKYGANSIIYGHVHKPQPTLNIFPKLTTTVLGCWDDKSPRFAIIDEHGNISLESYVNSQANLHLAR